jgi:hypothetical protein
LAADKGRLQNRRAPPTMVAAALMLAMTSGGCSIASDRTCFTKRPGVVLPDRAKVLANVSNGGSGRLLAEAVLDGKRDEAAAMLARDPRLLQTIVTHDPRMDAAPAGQAGDLLTFAVARCDRDMIDMLLKAGMPADGVKIGNALALALLADTPDMAELLLKAGASPDPQKLAGGEDAMAAAMTFSHPGAVMTLLRHGGDPRYVDAFGVDRVREAVGTEQTDIAEILVKAGASLWTVAEDGSMAIHDLSRPAMLFKSPALKAARDRLLALAETQAKAANLPWPPPDLGTMRTMFESGQWPTPAMLKVGMAPSAKALARMKTP